MQQKTKDTILTGVAIFTQLFGASNLIFPPSLGAESQSLWLVSYLGFMVTVFIALFAIYVLNQQGGYTQFGSKIGKTFMRVFMFVILVPILTVLVLPRTSAVAFEAGFQPHFPNIHPLWFYSIYFILAAVLAFKETKVNANVGKILGPIMIFSILLVIVIGVFTIPASYSPIQYTGTQIFAKGLSAGYQTADALGAFVQGGLTLVILQSQGYSRDEQTSVFVRGGIIFTLLIGLFYLGLFYIGSVIAPHIQEGGALSNSQFLHHTVLFILGPTGSLIFSVIIVLTCFTTNVGFFGVISSYFSREYNLKYAHGIIFLTCIWMFIPLLGVEMIILISLPLFKLVCPILVVLLFCNYFKVQSALAVKIITYSSILITGLHVLYTDFHVAFLKSTDSWPLAKEGLIWVLPTIIVALACRLLIKNKEKTN